MFFLVGILVAGLMFQSLLRPLWRASHSYVEGICVVLDKRIGESHGDDGTTYRPEIHIQYSVDGKDYDTWTYDAARVYSSGLKGKQAIINRYQIGGEYPFWYDPEDPSKAVLVRGFSWAYLFILLPLVFVVVGAGGMWFTLKGGAKQPVRNRVVAELARSDLSDAPGKMSLDSFPNVPSGYLGHSPGTKLKYRLQLAVSPGCALAGILFVALFWNGITSVFVGIAVRRHLDGRPEWFMTIFITPFVLIGLGLIFACFRQLLVSTGIGRTVAEISDHPLCPGRSYQVWLSQSGNLKVNKVQLLLVCDEEARYRQGTSTRTETKRVFKQQLFEHEAFEVQKGLPYETQVEFRVPDGVMHSFEAGHNKVAWKLVVKGDIAGWPDYDREFSVVILPPGSDGTTQ
jgi:hypothetical protein